MFTVEQEFIFNGKIYKVTGRKVTKKGYILLLIHGFPGSQKSGHVMEHRVIMSLVVGRPLLKTEIVHHRDENKQNNFPKNLKLTTVGRHTIKHHTGLKRSKETRFKISQKAKQRFKCKSNHPFYKDIDPNELKSLHDSGKYVKEICKEYGICKRTFYNKINELRKGA